jgi:glycosyltransferase involved in cell wall biosynthesis
MARVLQVVTELVVGGASLTMLDLAEDLAQEHEIVIAHGRLDDPGNAAAIRARTRFATYELQRLARPISARDDIASARAFASICRRVRPDVIHTHSSKAGFVGRLAAPPSAAVRLHTIHGWGHTPLDPPARRRLLIAAERAAALRTTRLIAVSPETRDEGLALGIGRPSQYTVIGAPVDMHAHASDFAAARIGARSNLRLSPGAEVIGWVGRFSAQKDPQALALVLARLIARRPDAHAVLVGDGPERQAVEHALAPEISAGRLLLTGARDDVRELYPAFDVLIHTSLWEGHPRVVREALAERVPVVTARVGGTRLVSADIRLGAEVEPGNVAAYVDAITAILDSPVRRAPIEEAALASARAAAAADDPYRLMRELYRATLAVSERTTSPARAAARMRRPAWQRSRGPRR